jgi:hypothetical protein
MQAFRSALKAWRALGSVAVVTDSSPVVHASPLLERELDEALTWTAQAGHGLGDAFVFGHCRDGYDRALARALPAEARVFTCVDGPLRAERAKRGGRWLEAAELDAHVLRDLRTRHHVQRVSVLIVAEDFAWSLGRVVHGMRSLLAAHSTLLVAGRQAALLETMWLDELRSGQRAYDVACFDQPASSWARFMLRRRPFV